MEHYGKILVLTMLFYGSFIDFLGSIMGFFGSRKKPIFWVKIMDQIRQNMGFGGKSPDFPKFQEFQRKQQKIEIAENTVICRN